MSDQTGVCPCPSPYCPTADPAIAALARCRAIHANRRAACAECLTHYGATLLGGRRDG